MNRVMIWATALLLMVATMTVVSQETEAGLFSRGNDCCKPAKCCKQKKCRDGLFAKRKAKKACCEPTCCEPTCCEAAPVCCKAAPTCCKAAPVCCAAPAPCAAVTTCCCEEPINCDCLSPRKLRRANRKGQCCGVKANTCGNSVEASAPVKACACGATTPGACTCGKTEATEEAPTAPDSAT